MTPAEQQMAAQAALDLWQSMLPEQTHPPLSSFLMWCGKYDSSTISRGITRAALKYKRMQRTGEPMSIDDAARYASSVMRNEAQGSW